MCVCVAENRCDGSVDGACSGGGGEGGVVPCSVGGGCSGGVGEGGVVVLAEGKVVR